MALQPDIRPALGIANSLRQQGFQDRTFQEADRVRQQGFARQDAQTGRTRNALRALHGGDTATALGLAPETVQPFQRARQVNQAGQREALGALAQDMTAGIDQILRLPENLRPGAYTQLRGALAQRHGEQNLGGVPEVYQGPEHLLQARQSLAGIGVPPSVQNARANRGFRTSEREAAQEFTAGQNQLDRASREQAAKLRASGAPLVLQQFGGGDPVPPTQTVDTDVDPSLATGPGAIVGSLGNFVADILGTGLPAPETQRAIDMFRNLNVQTVTALQDAVPGRPSKFLLQKLEELAVKPASLAQGDGRAFSRLKSTRNLLADTVRELERIAPGLSSKANRDKAMQKHGELSRLMRTYDEVLRPFAISQGDIGNVTAGDIAEMSPRALRMLAEHQDKFTDEQREAMAAAIVRLRESR